MNRKLTAAASAAALAGLTFVGVAAAHADPAPSFVVYDEGDSPNPYNVVDGLVFYRAADLGWVVNTPISGVQHLDYTVASGTSYAPSFQLITHSDQKSYARLVWEPYMQGADLNPNSGEYTNLQDGLWWTNKIQSGPGSQADPQPLAFFSSPTGTGWTNVSVIAVDVHQGSTTDATSVVTKVAFNGNSIALGTTDATPFDQSDIDDATAPVHAQVSSLTGEVSSLTGQVASLTGQVASLTGQVRSLTADKATLQAYKATHSHADTTYNAKLDQILALRAAAPFTVSGTAKAGSTLTVGGTKAAGVTYTYQWAVAGKNVRKATSASFKLPQSAVGHTVKVIVTRTYTDSKGASHSIARTSYAMVKAGVK
ncbi:MAG: hypothetical protein AAGC49_10910 [Brevundimonas sp.]